MDVQKRRKPARMKKPTLKDFDAPSEKEAVKFLNRKLELAPPKPSREQWLNSLEKTTIILTTIVVCILLTVFEGEFGIWMIPAGLWLGITFAVIIYLCSEFISEKEKKLEPELKIELDEINTKLSNRERFNEAMKQWSYFNLITGKGYWMSLKGLDLEKGLMSMLQSFSWDVQTTSIIGDEGIDLICEKNSKKVLIQCKGHSKPLGVGAIRDAAGVKSIHNPHSMVVVAPNGFTKGSIKVAKKSDVKLLDVFSLIKIAKQKQDLI